MMQINIYKTDSPFLSGAQVCDSGPWNVRGTRKGLRPPGAMSSVLLAPRQWVLSSWAGTQGQNMQTKIPHRNRVTDIENKLRITKGERWRKDKFGIWD